MPPGRFSGRGSQVVRQRSAKPSSDGSIPPRASNLFSSTVLLRRHCPLMFTRAVLLAGIDDSHECYLILQQSTFRCRVLGSGEQLFGSHFGAKYVVIRSLSISLSLLSRPHVRPLRCTLSRGRKTKRREDLRRVPPLGPWSDPRRRPRMASLPTI